MKAFSLNSKSLRTKMAFFVALLGTIWLASYGCRTTSPRSSDMAALPLPTDNSALLEAVTALNSIGAKTPYLEGESRCAGACHLQAWHVGIDVTKVQRWGQLMQDVNACFTGVDQIAGSTPQDKAQKKIRCFLLDPTQPDGGYDAAKLGFYRIGADSALFENMFKDAYGTAEDANAYKPKFEEFVAKTKMPSNQSSTQAQLDALWPWVLKGMPNLNTAFGQSTNPGFATCTDNVSDELKAHIKAINSPVRAEKNWAFKNMSDPSMDMLGCVKPAEGFDYFRDGLTTPLDCFRRRDPSGNPYRLTVSNDSTRGWTEHYMADGTPIDQKMRIIKDIPFTSTYWTRSSADGRFFGSGMKQDPTRVLPRGSLGFIADLKDPNRPYIGVTGPYDPGFFPDNKGFTFMTERNGAFFCSQLHLNKPSTKFIDLAAESRKTTPDRVCGNDRNLGVYQHVGASPDGQSYFVVRSDNYENDDGANQVKSDPPVGNFAVQTSAVEVWPMDHDSQAPEAFVVKPVNKINIPFEGDFGIFPSTSFITSRIAQPLPNAPTQFGQAGYSIRKFDPVNKTTEKVANVCLKGGKMSVAFNERIVVTHHYTDASDAQDLSYSPEDPEFQGMIANSANIWIYDLLTGKKMRITRMRKGQFALYPHFRADGWLYFLVRDTNSRSNEHLVATDVAIRFQLANSIE